jgi:hypothetical protein
MSFWQMLGLVSAVATILGVFLTIYAIINNRPRKEEFRLTREMMPSHLAPLVRITSKARTIIKSLPYFASTRLVELV